VNRGEKRGAKKGDDKGDDKGEKKGEETGEKNGEKRLSPSRPSAATASSDSGNFTPCTRNRNLKSPKTETSTLKLRAT
jgi:hypothetical protein